MSRALSAAFATVCTALVCLLLMSAASADPIVYTIEAVGSGDLGPNPFTETHFTLTGTVDTSQITSPFPRIFVISNSTATISVTDIGIASFTIPTMNFVNQNTERAGLSAPSRTYNTVGS